MQSVVRALEVLECVAELQPVGVSEVARQLDQPKSTAQRSLVALADAGWVSKTDGDGSTRWQLTVRAVLLGRTAGNQFGVRDAALHHMEVLRQETQETIHLALAREASVILVERLESPHPVRYVEAVGGAASIFLTATGKAILASTPLEERMRLFVDYSGELEERMINRTELLEELQRISEIGYATTTGWRDGVFATAAAVRNGGLPIAAISISAPLSRVSDDDRLRYGRLIRETAKAIGQELRSRY